MERLRTTIGEEVSLTLVEQSGAGYLWSVDRELLAAGSLFVTFLRDDVNELAVGGPSTVTCKILSHVSGTFALSLTHSRPWEPTLSHEVRHLLVEVT